MGQGERQRGLFGFSHSPGLVQMFFEVNDWHWLVGAVERIHTFPEYPGSRLRRTPAKAAYTFAQAVQPGSTAAHP